LHLNSVSAFSSHQQSQSPAADMHAHPASQLMPHSSKPHSGILALLTRLHDQKEQTHANWERSDQAASAVGRATMPVLQAAVRAGVMNWRPFTAPCLSGFRPK